MNSMTPMAPVLTVMLCLAVHAVADETSPDPAVTPFFADPQRLTVEDHGQPVDHVALANTVLSEGVTPENNAAVIIATLMREADWGAGSPAAFRSTTFEKLGAPLPGPESVRFVSFHDHVDERRAVGAGAEAAQWEADWQVAQTRPWRADELPLVADWLAQQDAALDLLAEGVQRKRYWMPWVRDDEADMTVLDLRLPVLQFVRSLARALLVRANHRLANDDPDAAVDDLLAMKRLAAGFKQSPLSLEHLVGISIAAMSNELVVTLLAEAALTAEQARRLITELAPTSGRFPVERAIDVGERLTVLDLVTRLPLSERTWEIVVHDFNKPEGLDPPQWIHDPWLADQYFDHDRAMPKVNATFDALVAAARLPRYTDRREAMLVVETSTRWSDEDAFAAYIPWGMATLLGPEMTEPRRRERYTDLVTGLLLDAFGSGRDFGDTTGTHNGMLGELEIVAIALAGYHADQGRYPQSLAALTPGWLDAVPVDVFDAADRPVRYRLEPERVVLYSIGRNGEDNGGVDTGHRHESDLLLTWPHGPSGQGQGP